MIIEIGSCMVWGGMTFKLVDRFSYDGSRYELYREERPVLEPSGEPLGGLILQRSNSTDNEEGYRSVKTWQRAKADFAVVLDVFIDDAMERFKKSTKRSEDWRKFGYWRRLEQLHEAKQRTQPGEPLKKEDLENFFSRENCV